MMIDAHFWKAYCDPYFKFENTIPTGDFVIVTANNPESQRLPDQENLIRNRCLQCDLALHNFAIVVVGNVDFSWCEEIFASPIPINLAIELGQKYQQNAIYFVQDDQLYLLSCLPDRTKINLGEWRHRIK
ncbi:hypothetical protein BIY22_14115 [Vibrio panuliri]|uniref:DUF3293 domain-containing protein n=2 Tax=Vibrio panuliri TaxID=1381081 RepID=A0A1Q9H9M9_9VIBR|nr:hypothetical protein BIY22_14115 [Vibrio panuliri]